jgi:alpha-L-fucosidase
MNPKNQKQRGVKIMKIENEKRVEKIQNEVKAEEIDNGIHNYSREESWIKPEDPLLLERLEWFQDQKLGLMMHWGPYSQIGIVESWALSDADANWSRGGVDWEQDGEEFKRQYFNLNKTFNPIRFQPEVWADLAVENSYCFLAVEIVAGKSIRSR